VEPAGLLSASIEGMSATAPAAGSLFVQLWVESFSLCSRTRQGKNPNQNYTKNHYPLAEGPSTLDPAWGLSAGSAFHFSRKTDQF
jgi:hypothetical protein